jgi:hypothetical protein
MTLFASAPGAIRYSSASWRTLIRVSAMPRHFHLLGMTGEGGADAAELAGRRGTG